MISIYTRRADSNRRAILLINGTISKVDPDAHDVRFEASDRDSDLTYVIHLSPEAIAGLHRHAQSVPGRLLIEMHDEEIGDPPAVPEDVPPHVWATLETAQRKAHEWKEKDGRTYAVRYFDTARDGKGGYAPVLIE